MPWNYMREQRMNSYMIKAEWLRILGIVLVSLLSWGFLLQTVQAAGSAYILYDAAAKYGSGVSFTSGLEEYLGHFGLECDACQLQEWESEKIHAADVVVITGLQDTVMPTELLLELSQARKVIWLGKNIEQLAAIRQWQDFYYGMSLQGGWLQVADPRVRAAGNALEALLTMPGTSAKLLAVAKNASGQAPLAWQRENVYYCGSNDINPSTMVLLENFFHQALDPGHAAPPRFLLRLEGVSPFTDPQQLQRTIAAVRQYHIPFAIAVSPVAVGQDGQKARLHEKVDVVTVLQEAQANGASIIMCGYMQQNDFSVPGDPVAEFWNGRDDCPLPEAGKFTAKRLEAGLEELMRCSLIPLAFAAPGNAMSEQAYDVLGQYFNIFVGQLQLRDDTAKDKLALPYRVVSPKLSGMTLLPDNAGSCQTADGPGTLLRLAAELAQGTHGFASGGYPVYLDEKMLPGLIEQLQKQGYGFFDLRQQTIRVQSAKISIAGAAGDFQIYVAPGLQDEWEHEVPGKSLGERWGTIHIIILSLLLGVLVLLIVHLHMTARRKYETAVDRQSKDQRGK